MDDRATYLKSILHDLHVPIAVMPDIGNDLSSKQVCSAIDRFFDDAIAGYPEAIRTFISRTYHGLKDGARFTDQDGNTITIRMDEFKNIGGWGVVKKTDDEKNLHFEYVISSDVYAKLPMHLRKNMIHELGVHVGQDLQRLRKVGLDQFKKENIKGGDDPLGVFTEMSAALADKLIVDAVPLDKWIDEINEANIKGLAGPPEDDISALPTPTMSEWLRFAIKDVHEMKFSDVVRLKHRGYNQSSVTSTQWELFSRRPEVKAVFPESEQSIKK